MIARCVVKRHKSSLYSAIRDACRGAGVKEGRREGSTADEVRNEKLFYEIIRRRASRECNVARDIFFICFLGSPSAGE